MLARILLLALLIIGSVSLLRAAEPHDWEYLEGNWTFQSSNGYSADIEYKSVAGGVAAVGKWTEEGGGETIETLGWRPDRKALVSTAFGTGEKFWQYEYTEVSENMCRGNAVFVDPNGTVIEGKVSLKREGPDLVSGQLVGSTKNGQQVKIAWTFTRKRS